MSDHITEEEQIEAFKRWWTENGRSIVVGILVAVVGYVGWQGWQSQQQQSIDEASLLFEDLMEAAVVEPGQVITQEQYLKVDSLAQELKDDYASSLYASDAALWVAKLAVEHDELERAQTELQWVVDKDHQGLGLIARMRLAQVQYAQQQFDAALSTLNGTDPDTYAGAYAELKGDIYVAQDKQDAARTAYQTAFDDAAATQSSRREIIQMKLDNIPATGADSE